LARTKKNVPRKDAKLAKKNGVLLQIFALLAPWRETIQTTVLYDVTGIAVKLLEKLSSSCELAIQMIMSLSFNLRPSAKSVDKCHFFFFDP